MHLDIEKLLDLAACSNDAKARADARSCLLAIARNTRDGRRTDAQLALCDLQEIEAAGKIADAPSVSPRNDPRLYAPGTFDPEPTDTPTNKTSIAASSENGQTPEKERSAKTDPAPLQPRQPSVENGQANPEPSNDERAFAILDLGRQITKNPNPIFWDTNFPDMPRYDLRAPLEAGYMLHMTEFVEAMKTPGCVSEERLKSVYRTEFTDWLYKLLVWSRKYNAPINIQSLVSRLQGEQEAFRTRITPHEAYSLAIQKQNSDASATYANGLFDGVPALMP